MTTITGTYNHNNGSFRMHAPAFPYDSTLYIGYTLEEMKVKYRADHNLKSKHLDWIILGLPLELLK